MELIKKAGAPKYEGSSFYDSIRYKYKVPKNKMESVKFQEMLQAAQSKSIWKRDSNLFSDYGFGIQVFMNSLFQLFLLYCVLSVFAIIIMHTYYQFGFLQNHLHKTDGSQKGFFHQLQAFSLGNVGFSQSLCFF